MLVLTRRIAETIYQINPDGSVVKMTILGVKGNQVRLGVEAPKNVTIHREEIMKRILLENDGKIPGTLYSEDQQFNNDIK